MLRRLGLVLAAAVFLAAPSTASAASPAASPSFTPDVLARPTSRLLAGALDFWGGKYPVAGGLTVTIYTSDTFPVDQQGNQELANFLASAYHGSELSSVTIFRLNRDELDTSCGSSDALACYDPGQETIFTPFDDIGVDFTARAALLHEYGHHVATFRDNRPFNPTVDFGPKRWATRENVCARWRRGELFPGAEENIREYRLNPGEGWAETYRVLNERHLGLIEAPWQAVSDRFIPNAADLSAARLDVLRPWAGPTVRRLTGKLAARKSRTYRIATPLDGTLSVRGPSALRMRLITKGLWKPTQGVGRAGGVVCGQRTVQVRVTATRTAAYTLTVSRP